MSGNPCLWCHSYDSIKSRKPVVFFWRFQEMQQNQKAIIKIIKFVSFNADLKIMYLCFHWPISKSTKTDWQLFYLLPNNQVSLCVNSRELTVQESKRAAQLRQESSIGFYSLPIQPKSTFLCPPAPSNFPKYPVSKILIH